MCARPSSVVWPHLPDAFAAVHLLNSEMPRDSHFAWGSCSALRCRLLCENAASTFIFVWRACLAVLFDSPAVTLDRALCCLQHPSLSQLSGYRSRVHCFEVVSNTTFKSCLAATVSPLGAGDSHRRGNTGHSDAVREHDQGTEGGGSAGGPAGSRRGSHQGVPAQPLRHHPLHRGLPHR